MIDYSVYLLNNPVKPEEPAKAYGANQVREVWSLEKFSKHIADHNGVYSRGTVKGVISDMCECLVEQLLNGNKIKLGELGDFSITLNTEGAESKEKFTSTNIKAVNILFTPGEDFENLVDKAEFNLVASRAAQAAVLKAVKANADSVDLSALKKPSTSTDDDTPTDPSDGGGTPSGGGSSSDSGSSSDKGEGSEPGGSDSAGM